LGGDLDFNVMKGQKKTPKIPGFMRTIMAQNLQKLLDHHYRALPNITKKQHALAKDSGVRFSTIQRACKAENGPTLDTIEAIAAAVDLSAYQILIPSLEVGNPQVVKGATKEEERMYRNWKRMKVTTE
jgi:DNA-binding phage protein